MKALTILLFLLIASFSFAACASTSLEKTCSTSQPNFEKASFDNLDYNSIQFFEAKPNDSNIMTTIYCVNNQKKVSFSLKDNTNSYTFELRNSQGTLIGDQSTSVDCNTSPIVYYLIPADLSRRSYILTATMPSTCRLCVKESFLTFGAGEAPTQIPDVGSFGLILVLLTVVIIISFSRAKKP